MIFLPIILFLLVLVMIGVVVINININATLIIVITTLIIVIIHPTHPGCTDDISSQGGLASLRTRGDQFPLGSNLPKWGGSTSSDCTARGKYKLQKVEN